MSNRNGVPFKDYMKTAGLAQFTVPFVANTVGPVAYPSMQTSHLPSFSFE